MSVTRLGAGLVGALGLAADGWRAPAAVSGTAPRERNSQPEPCDGSHTSPVKPRALGSHLLPLACTQ